jgi:UDP-N-acetylglucosamine enolpyruvyl transferase
MKCITLKWAKDRRACRDAVIAFKKRFGTKATTKDTLAWLNEINLPGWIAWTMGQDDVGITEELLSHGADVHARGDYALQWAAENGHTDTVKLLVEHGADIHAYGDGALRLAAWCGHTEIAEFLRQAGR